MKKGLLALLIAAPAILCSCGEIELIYSTEYSYEYEGSLSLYSEEKVNIERDPKATVVADFEEWNPSFQTMCVCYNFGRVTRNEDTQYVKTGNYSALLQPIGNLAFNYKPVCYWPLTALDSGIKLSNLSTYATVEFDFYNTTNFKIQATVGLVSEIRSCSDISLINGTTTALSKNEWTHVSYTIDSTAIAKAGGSISNVAGIYISFPVAKSRDFAQAPTVYVDDVILMKK